MDTLVIVAFVVTVAIVAMGTYIKSHPPDASELGFQRHRTGLRLGMVSSAAILLMFLILAYVPAAQHLPKLPFALFGVAGNIVNLMGIVDCLREVNGEALFAALLLVFSELLWIVFMVPTVLG
jgi:hypothetical protein